MSDFGFFVENDDGQILIDDFNDMYRLIEQGETTQVSSDDYLVNAEVNFNTSIPPDEPIICAFRLDITGIGYTQMKLDGSGNKVGVRLAEETPQGGIPYILFARYGWNPVPTTDAEYGLQVFGPSPDNRVIYDSRVAELQVVDIVDIGHPTGEQVYTGSHQSKPQAFYDVASLDQVFEVAIWYGAQARPYVRPITHYYKQVSSTTIECTYYANNIPVAPNQFSMGSGVHYRGDGRCIVVDTDIYY